MGRGLVGLLGLVTFVSCLAGVAAGPRRRLPLYLDLERPDEVRAAGAGEGAVVGTGVGAAVGTSVDDSVEDLARDREGALSGMEGPRESCLFLEVTLSLSFCLFLSSTAALRPVGITKFRGTDSSSLK